MAVDTNNVLSWAQGFVSGAVLGTGDPGAPSTVNTTLPNPWYDFGAITQDGLTENPNESRQEFYRWGSIAPFAVQVTKREKTFQVTFLEKNPQVLGLYYGTGATPTTTGTSSNEVQTVTISGSPTGGSFILDYNGNPTGDIAWNATPATVQTALQALPGLSGNVTVSGTAGSSYVLTFGGALAAGNVAQLGSASNLTGGTSPTVSVATTTGGAAGSLLTITDDTTGIRDVRAFCFDLVNGTNHERYYVPQGEVTNRGSVVSKFDDVAKYQVTITAYPNASGIAVKRYYLLDAIRLGL